MPDKLKMNFLKSLRTIIGLPVVLILWPFTLSFGFLCIIISLILAIVRFIMDGNTYKSAHSYDRDEVEAFHAGCKGIFFPFYFIKKIIGN